MRRRNGKRGKGMATKKEKTKEQRIKTEKTRLNATMKTGDVIEINTKYGSKGAKLIRDGVETDYFRYIDVDSTFMQLAIGDNMFRYDAASGVNSLEVSIFYSKEFLGV